MQIKYMREGLKREYTFLSLQDKILEIALYIDSLCRDYEIDYCLMGGSALGAKRDGGFIPWDDDLDIFMTPSNYEKFRDIFKLKGDNEKYYLQEWGAIDGMVTISKIRMNGTTYIEENLKEWNIHHGIYVDIWLLHTCPNSKLKQLKQFLWAKYVVMKGLAIRGYNRRKGFLGFSLKVMQHLPDNMWVRIGLKQVYKYQKEKTKYYCNFMGKALFKNAIYKKEYFEKTEYAPFEKARLRVPIKLHEFLTDRFGNYMMPPSPERIKWEQHAEYWSVDQDFKEILKRDSNFFDEKRLI